MIHEAKYQALQHLLREMDSVIVAYSGGADSALVLKVAHQVLGNRALGVIAVSASYPESERDQAVALAREIGVPVEEIRTDEMDDPNYVANHGDRCYFCKHELFTKLEALRQDRGFAVIADGYNADDVGDFRPGIKAAAEQQVRHPLQAAGLTKAEIRDISKELHLATWDKPAMACLSSRIPHGTPIQVGMLEQVDKAEQFLRGLGFRQLRVRHHNKIARIEVEAAELPRLAEPQIRDQVVRELKRLGYAYVTVDLAGYRMGSLNATNATNIVTLPMHEQQAALAVSQQ
ncbi:MAG: ATP-dependent sacrificial sulfur transferase LarE [Chloroflexota bacterium]